MPDADPDDAWAKSEASVFMIAASVLIFATRLLFAGSPLAAATICRILIKAGAAAAKMESSVETQAVEHAVQNTARDSTMARTFLIKTSPYFSDLNLAARARVPVAKFLQLRLDEYQLPLNTLDRGLIAASHSLQRRNCNIAYIGLRHVLCLPCLIRDSLLL